jgi:hypothetical protein
MSRSRSASPHRGAKILLTLAGLIVGAGQLALGAHLASGNNGWPASLLFSVIGLVAAPLAGYSWSSMRSRNNLILAGIAVGLGVLASMGLMLDVTQEQSGIVQAWSQAPYALLGWMLVWIFWGAVALARLLLFTPPRTRHRLSSRRGDAGN